MEFLLVRLWDHSTFGTILRRMLMICRAGGIYRRAQENLGCQIHQMLASICFGQATHSRADF